MAGLNALAVSIVLVHGLSAREGARPATKRLPPRAKKASRAASGQAAEEQYAQGLSRLFARDVHDECRRDQFRTARFHTLVIAMPNRPEPATRLRGGRATRSFSAVSLQLRRHALRYMDLHPRRWNCRAAPSGDCRQSSREWCEGADSWPVRAARLLWDEPHK